MEGDPVRDKKLLLVLLRKLKEVFEACDEDADGFIQVKHLLHIAQQLGQGDEVRTFISFLNPHTHGKLSFKDFCRGVFAIKGYEEILKMVLSPVSLTSNQAVPANTSSHCQPFPESSAHAKEREKESCNVSAIMDSAWQNQEEQFEDYGEGEDVEYSPSSPRQDDGTQANGISDLGSSLPPSVGHTPQKTRQLYTRELLDIYCSQCCKKVNLLNDLDAHLQNVKANSPNRKISSTAFGRQLFQANHSVFHCSQGSSTEDLLTDSVDSCDVNITEKVSYLEKKVTELENDSLANGYLKSKLKQENTKLVHRVHELEEQMKDVEARADQSLEEETRRHCDVYCKMEGERNTEIDFLCSRIQQLLEENGEMKTNVCRLKSQTEKLDQEKQKETDKLEDTSLRLKDEVDTYRKIMDKLWQNRREFHKEKESMLELVDDLRKELDYLQLFQMEMENPGKGRELCEYNGKPREVEMEHDVNKLKQENHKLRNQNDDLNAQILSLSLYESKSLFSCHSKVQCLAAEIDNASKDELVDALKAQEEINLRLRKYMDKIILAILDHNPSILEIKC
ncbi:rab11 family-interacting protein 4A isoform X2 [Dunckerocampus dactyliophorus]|uniref:rab11 family-interacting protein 4A isoform X2 n=1 Tax=Dunckerocampus dactyliophorus TaxID=161453 RepID=UPI0024062AEE|nr:rab11 family-interacting protein 4A isoform X2 [Dunckerocampus dactyliophorus]